MFPVVSVAGAAQQHVNCHKEKPWLKDLTGHALIANGM